MKDIGSMAPRKLSDSDKSEIVDLYKQPGQTTSTLAEQFGVSNSTVSRILKNSLPAEEYSELISQKRMAGSADKPSAKKSGTKGRTRKTKKAEPLPVTPSAMPELESESPAAMDELETDKVAPPKLKKDKSEDKEEASTPRRRRRRSREATAEENGQLALLDDADDSEANDSEANDSDADDSEDVEETQEIVEEKRRPAAPVLANHDEGNGDDDDDDEDDLSGLDDSLDDDFGDDEDELEEDDDDDDVGVEMPKPKVQLETAVEIMPLDQAVLPKPCYLVVDMRAELITRPLSEFADLGQIPSSEEKAKTLPVFDNHRVARRFSRNKQRVIKVPDGGLITRTSPYLAAKGITRLLVDGQVFDLMD